MSPFIGDPSLTAKSSVPVKVSATDMGFTSLCIIDKSVKYLNCSWTMTEVRPAGDDGSLSVFATQSWGIGDVILKEEAPIVVLSPSSAEEEQALLSLMTNAPSSKNRSNKAKSKGSKKKSNKCTTTTTLYRWVHPPSSVPDAHEGNFRGMVQAAACFSVLHQPEQVQEKLLQLYHPKSPPSADEHIILQVAKDAMQFIQKQAKPDSPLYKIALERPELLTNVMLIWSCNAFQGGRIYQEVSRINHSCNPNAVVVEPTACAQKTGQLALTLTVKAAAAISPGEEITISYLGLFLYADRNVRQEQLLRNKHFTCTCSRCANDKDFAAAIPCPSCHKRHGRYLDEDIQYDDDQTVHYCTPPPDNKSILTTCACDHCHESTTLPDTGDPNHPLRLVQTVSDKVLNYLQDREHAKSSADDDDGNTMAGEWEEQLLQLASTVTGSKHWTTNIMMLLQLDRILQNQHSTMILNGTQPDMSEVAEGIDSLERLCSFANGLSLKLHMGHVLSNAVIGVARTLVTLGDTKSQKYAAQWIGKIKSDYVDHFESEGMQKVVDTLFVAWENPGTKEMAMQCETEEEDSGQGSNKRAKAS